MHIWQLNSTTSISWYYGITSHDHVFQLNVITWSCPLVVSNEWLWERCRYSLSWSLCAELTVDHFRFKCSSTHSDTAARGLRRSLPQLVLHIVREFLSRNGLRFSHRTIALPDGQIYWGAMFIGIKLYSNSVLAAVKSRQSLSARHQHAFSDTTAFGASFIPDVSSVIELSAISRERQINPLDSRSRSYPNSRVGKITPKASRDNVIQIKVSRTQEGFIHNPRENLE
ncbi:hypothetical protein BD311DRAFT_778435 [Dichomitus squalens]|uniref:Uncharacterized protein n=1 Tax=Dichomitus squalens TaxID=114155 RepID=A0A4V2K0B1_9APHY|nr:hypothetical protein BD311DRAFT_778435 [Dichomitus squalens]